MAVGDEDEPVVKLTLQTDYALRTLMYLAVRPGRHPLKDVATFFAISPAHVAKVVQFLVKAGWIRSLRGIGGGIELARSPTEITIGEVVSRSEGDVHLLDCLAMEDVCVIQRFCRLKTVLSEAERLQRDYLQSVRLSDVLPSGLGVQHSSPVSAAPAVATSAPDPSRKSKPSVEPGDGQANTRQRTAATSRPAKRTRRSERPG
jgi:Rrf2 family transcriptional regulator, nitric oxide-sensitive transcriptional repressor